MEDELFETILINVFVHRPPSEGALPLKQVPHLRLTLNELRDNRPKRIIHVVAT